MAGRFDRAPGVYEQRRATPQQSILLVPSGVPAFLGLARRGPLDAAVRVTSFDDFKKEFGRPVDRSYLSEAVYGFFANGGKECLVVRIAHRSGAGEVAKRASFQALDRLGRPSLLIEAANEGLWGNDIEVEIRLPEAAVQTYLTFDLEEDQTHATVKSALGFERGTLVRIYDGSKEHYATLSDVESKVLRWRERDAVPFTFKSSDLTYIEPVEFDVFVREGGRREVFRGMSLAYGSERHPERVSKTSQLVRMTVMEAEGPLSDRLPTPVAATKLTSGQDGLDLITPEDFIGMNEGPGHRYALATLEENEDLDLIVAPDIMACREFSEAFASDNAVEQVQQKILDHCDRLKDRFAILDIPPRASIQDALAWRLRFDSEFGAFYYPWLVVPSGSGQRIVPPSGHVAGVFSRCDQEVGPNRAAANEVVQGVTQVEFPLDEEEIGYLNGHSVNPIRLVPARGVRIWGARTCASRKEWRYVPVRRVMNLIRRTIYHGTQWVVFESNEPSLWMRIEGQLKFFLQGLFENGFFAGESPGDAFYVKCNAETNSPERRAAGELVAEIGVAPVRPAEFLRFELQQQLPDAGGG